MAMTPEEQAAYESGYEDGESNQLADWQFALEEHGELPEDVEVRPMSVARYLTGLHQRIKELGG